MANTTLATIKKLTSTVEVQKRFNSILGRRAPQFIASLVNAVAGSTALSACEPNSIMSAAFTAAALDLPIDPNLGFAAIVPYRKRQKNELTGRWEDVTLAQFQMMYKGFVQLAIRSGEYQKMGVSEVYEDEFIGYNPITGEMTFTEDFSQCTQRNAGETDRVVGYYAWFRLHSGFTQELYMTKQAVQNHARRYSQAYRYDVEKGRKSSPWSTDFDAMAKKTVLKQLLSKWGILSVQMQKSLQTDQMVYGADGTGQYADNQPDQPADEVIDVFPADAPDAQVPQAQPAKTPEPPPEPVQIPMEEPAPAPAPASAPAPKQADPAPRAAAYTQKKTEPARTGGGMEDEFAAFDALFGTGEEPPF